MVARGKVRFQFLEEGPMSEILVTARNLSVKFGANPVIQNLQFSLHEGARVGLIGPNGMGKSTLLRVLAGEIEPDGGEVVRRRSLRMGYLPQVPHFLPGEVVEAAILGAVSSHEDWSEVGAAQEMISRLGLERYRHSPIEELSGGWKKRVALARELAKRPELLLLDEPTNHLDLETILWIEDFLKRAPFAALTVTHDRAFLDRVATKIAELNRRFPTGWFEADGNFQKFSEARESYVEGLVSRQVSLANVFRRETEWLRRGAKARTTKQQARIDRAGELEKEVKDLEVRNRSRSVGLDFQGSERLSKKLIAAEGVSKALGGRKLFENLSLTLRPGSRLGIVGANGLGKTTLIRVLLKELAPDSGEVLHSDSVQVAFFEQNRESLDPTLSLRKAVCPTGDSVIFRGASTHVRSYLDRFLFPAEQMELQVGKLSGGEQSRLLLAKLMLSPANVLVLDEPTNDLDLSTLAILEDALEDFPGAVIVVSHDRRFLQQTVDQLLAFSTSGVQFFAGVDQWEIAVRAQSKGSERKGAPEGTQSARMETPVAKSLGATNESPSSSQKRKRLSFGEQRELEGLESKLAQAEERVRQLTEKLGNPDPGNSPMEFKRLSEELHAASHEVEQLYHRWGELEAKSTGSR